jgi:hypothetical protein
MYSPGSGSDISAQDAADLLHKIIAEKLPVQAVFTGFSSLTAGLIGFAFLSADGTIFIKSDAETDGPFLRFDPRAATSFKYDDTRAMPNAKVTSQGLSVASALAFIYPDKTFVSLFEIPS